MSKEPTNTQILEGIEQLSTHVNGRLDALTSRFDAKINIMMQTIGERFDHVEKRLDLHDKKFDLLYNIVDAALVKSKRVEEDHASIIQWLKRHDVAIEKLQDKKETKKLKQRA